MQHMEQTDANEKRTDTKMKPQWDDCYSENSEAIEASIEFVKPKSKRKKEKLQERSSGLKPLKSTSSMNKVIQESTPPYFLKKSSASPPISMPLIGKKLQDKYSHSIFSSPQSIVTTKSPLGQVNLYQRHIDSSPATTILNKSFSSRVLVERFRSPQNNSKSDIELNEEWAKLSQRLSPKNSSAKLQLKRYASQEGQHPYSPFSDVTMNETIATSATKKKLQNSRIDKLDLDIQPLHQYVKRKKQSCSSSFSELNVNQEFRSPARARSSSRSSHKSQNDDLDSYLQLNEMWGDVNEQLKVQNVHQNRLIQQNHNISKQIEQFEGYVRDKMEQTETYMKQKLSQFEDSNDVIIKTLNDIKCLESEQPVRIGEGIRRKNPGFVMPKLPISKAVSLVILNNALKDTQYMEQFVSEVSRVVTLYVYNPRKSIKSVMCKMFTRNLLIKYSWSETSSGKGLPEFSALTGILRAINRLLTNYMSDRDMRIEIKDFFKRMPQMKSIRYF